MSSILKTGLGKAMIAIVVIIVVIIAAIIIGGNFDDGSDVPELVIITRHDTTITSAFRLAFLKSSYGKAAGYSPEDINKIDFKQVTTLQGWLTGLGSDSLKVDLAWGGGPTLFNQMGDAGLLKPITDVELLDIANASVPKEIAGAEMYHYDKQNKLDWVANAISSFGFTINNDYLKEYGLAKPNTWEDLASPDYFVGTDINTISMGNPTETTSNTRIYQIILQKYGWEKGWEILSRMAANGGIYGGSVETRSAVIDKRVGVAMTIDFYGVFAQLECSTCEYIIPENGSIVNGDPIAFGIKSGNELGAKEFFKFVNSAEGQAVWLSQDRLPVNLQSFNTTSGKQRTDLKQLYDDTIANQGINFDESLSTATEFTMQNYFDAAIVDAHPELKAAWGKAVNDLKSETIDEATFNSTVSNLFKPQLTKDEAIANNGKLIADALTLSSQKNTWTSTAKSTYTAYTSANIYNYEKSNENTIRLIEHPQQLYEVNYFVTVCELSRND